MMSMCLYCLLYISSFATKYLLNPYNIYSIYGIYEVSMSHYDIYSIYQHFQGFLMEVGVVWSFLALVLFII